MPIDCKTETVEFRDGSSLTLSESNWTIGMKLVRLTQEAATQPPLEDLDAQVFRVNVYPKLIAGVVDGIPPTEEQAQAMPESELDKWYNAAERLNPKWFVSPEPEAEAPAEEVKKKESAGVS